MGFYLYILFIEEEIVLKKIFKQIISSALSLSIAASVLPVLSAGSTVDVSAEPNSAYNYGEALQKSMFFYQAQQAGPIADWNQITWRADSTVNDYVQGGWYDAGDHIKFALTNAYSVTFLAWGMLEYGEGIEKAGLTDLYEKNIQWALDFLVGCDLGDEVVYQIGDIGFDHKWWGSAEVYLNKLELMEGTPERPYFTTKDTNITGEMAAALASGYLVFKDSNPELAATYLEHAENCFRIADETRDHGNTPASDAMYKSSHFYDELFWAANWMYMATGDQKYLDLCESDYIPNLGFENQSTELKFTWGMCWDDLQQGGTLLYAMNTGDTKWKEQFKKHLEYWTTGYGGKQVAYTPDGLAWLTNWGALRHATTTAFLAYVASDNLFADDATLNKKYIDFADSQMNYCFGDNNRKSSYVVGMGENYPKAWHHRTSSGVWNDKWGGIGQTEGEDAKPHAHTLYGALVGGPNQSGEYTDNISQYEYTEVACDYNAGYTAALCAMVEKYGGTSDPSFPPTETPKWDEFFIEACINQSSGSFTELKVQTTNHSAWPARTIKNLSYNYYMDFTELFEAGLTVDDVTVKLGMDEFQNCTISEPIQYDGNIYYVKISYGDGTKIMPTGQSEHQGEVQFRVSIPDPTPVWSAENDYSFEGLVSQDLVKTDKITLYDGDKLIWGTEPDGTTPDNSGSTGGDTDFNHNIKGDVNVDGTVDMTDLLTLKRYILNMVKLNDNQLKNADMNDSDSVNIMDVVMLCKELLK